MGLHSKLALCRLYAVIRPIAFQAFAMLVLLAGLLPAEENSPFVPGQTVMVSPPLVELLIEDRVIATVKRGDILQVSLVRDDWLFVWEKQAWIHRNDVWTTQQARQQLSEEIKNKPSADAHHLRGIAENAAQEFELAIADFNAALQLSPENASIHNNRGGALQKQGRLDDAIADFSKAIELSPKTPLFWINRSAAWAEAGNADKALADAQQAVLLAPNNAAAINSRGVSYYDKEEFELALADYSAAIKLAPHFTAAYSNRAAVLKRQDKFAEAAADYQEAVRLGQRNATAKNDFAWFLLTCPDAKYRDAKRAVGLAVEACTLTDNADWNLLDTLAVAYHQTGRHAQAVQTLEMAVKLAPADEQTALKQKLDTYRDAATKSK